MDNINIFEEAKKQENSPINIFNESIEKEKKIKSLSFDKKIEKIQLGLLLFLLVIGTLTYFFGYDLFESFIKID